ncbi:MAG: HAD family hydrolase [Chlorobi bacterium]|nr:HAD family hydrolase [Chlorobiota bacterium]
MKYKHIIWDYNGTLLNDASLCVEIINELLSARGLKTMSLQKYKQEFDFPVKDYYERAGFDFEKESFEIVGTEFIKEYNIRQKDAPLQKGAMNLLNEIKDKGIKQSVLSAREEQSLISELKKFNIFNYFEEVVGLNNHYAESKVERGKQLLSKIQVSKNEIVMIGDTKHDAEVAKEVGINCILVSHGHQTKDKLQTCGVKVFDNFEEVKKFIFN